MNVALSRLPSFAALPGSDPADHHGGHHPAPSLAYMDRAYQDARTFGWSREPIVEMLILHPRRQPGASGQHVATSSASTWRRNCRTGVPGTITARKSPI